MARCQIILDRSEDATIKNIVQVLQKSCLCKKLVKVLPDFDDTYHKVFDRHI